MIRPLIALQPASESSGTVDANGESDYKEIYATYSERSQELDVDRLKHG